MNIFNECYKCIRDVVGLFDELHRAVQARAGDQGITVIIHIHSQVEAIEDFGDLGKGFIGAGFALVQPITIAFIHEIGHGVQQ